MSEPYIDLITGRPLEPWAKEAMERRSEEAASCSIGSCRRHGKCMYVPCRRSPRAAVGEQSREVIARIVDPEAWQDVSNEDTYPAMLRRIAEGKAASLAKADAILALQSPPAKVEG